MPSADRCGFTGPMSDADGKSNGHYYYVEASGRVVRPISDAHSSQFVKPTWAQPGSGPTPNDRYYQELSVLHGPVQIREVAETYPGSTFQPEA